MSHKHFWKTSDAKYRAMQLEGEKEAEVVIVGAGITGLTTAYSLVEKGKSVVVLEAEEIAHSATSLSSAHLTTAVDYYYSNIQSNYNTKTAKMVAQSRKTAIAFISAMADKFPCDFRFVHGFLYSEDDKGALSAEHKAALEAGLKVIPETKMDLPFEFKQALRFEEEAVFNPYLYLDGLATYLQESGLCTIYQNTRVKSREGNKLITDKGSIEADDIVYATHYPVFIDMHQTMVYPYRSYMLAAKVEDYPGDALYWDTYSPYHYTRTCEIDGEKYLLVGGGDHKTGETEEDAYIKLEAYLHERYTVKEISMKWSSQYFEPADGLPYIGKSFDGKEYIATGFSGDGLVYGTLAGLLISDHILGTALYTDWYTVYDAQRLNPLKSSGKFTKENISVASHMVKDRLNAKKVERPPALSPGEGRVVNISGEKIAVSKNSDGQESYVSAVCPHLKCVVTWNKLEQTWDCPCHGSRFRSNGKLIAGPAVNGLKPVVISFD